MLSFPAGLQTASNKIKNKINKINSTAGQGRERQPRLLAGGEWAPDGLPPRSRTSAAHPHNERKKHRNEVSWGHNPS